MQTIGEILDAITRKKLNVNDHIFEITNTGAGYRKDPDTGRIAMYAFNIFARRDGRPFMAKITVHPDDITQIDNVLGDNFSAEQKERHFHYGLGVSDDVKHHIYTVIAHEFKYANQNHKTGDADVDLFTDIASKI